MNQSLPKLAKRIRSELDDLQIVTDRAHQVWKRSKTLSDDAYVDSAALNIHGFYSGLEKLFQQIASAVDDFKPTGAEWHQELLKQMATELTNVRPAIISKEMMDKLDEYRRFRHIVRNVYTFKLDAGRMNQLVVNLADLYAQARRELLLFADFLDQRARDAEE